MKDEQPSGMSRRGVLAAGIAGAAVYAGVRPESHDEDSAPAKKSGPEHGAKMPVVYLPHGGGPWPFVDTPFGSEAELSGLRNYLTSVGSVAGKRPAALLVVSAHWEEPNPTVMSGESPPMLYDYYGFPPESYRITWPAPGNPKLAARVRSLLESAGFQTGENTTRGYDHGTFVPMKLAFPAADVPVVQLSLKTGLDPKEHLAMGRAIAPLRDEGVLIVGSGMTYHNLRAFGPAAKPVSETFDAWLRQAALSEQKTRDAQLAAWTGAPGARAAHPREEHLIPMMVIAGAAGEDRGKVAYDGTLLDLRISAYHFG